MEEILQIPRLFTVNFKNDLKGVLHKNEKEAIPMNKINQNIRNTMRAGVFIVLFALLFAVLSEAFIPEKDNSEDGMESRISKAYRGESRNSLDVVFIGNSDMYRGVSPVDLYHNTGITSAIAGKPGKKFNEIPRDIKDILKYQSPKLLVIETDCMFSGSNPQFQKDGKASGQQNAADKKAESNIFTRQIEFLKKVKRAVAKGDSALIAAINYKFPLLKYHHNWHNIRLKSFFNKNQEYKFSNKGMAYSSAVKPYNYGTSYMKSEAGRVEALNDKDAKTFDKIYRLCKKNNIRLVLITIPSANTWNEAKSRAVQKIADQYKLTYYDYNVTVPEDFDWKTDSTDGGNHLNYKGAMKITRNLGDKLKNDLGMEESNLSKSEKAEWARDYKHFHEKIVGK